VTVYFNKELHSFTCHPHVHSQIEYAMPAFTLKPQSITTHWPVLIYHPHKYRRLSLPVWLVTHQGGLPVRRRSPIPVLTGPDVE